MTWQKLFAFCTTTRSTDIPNPIHAAMSPESIAIPAEKSRPIRSEYLIVDCGHLAGSGVRSDSAGDTIGGCKSAAGFKSIISPQLQML
jgi:hypothetical protein